MEQNKAQEAITRFKNAVETFVDSKEYAAFLTQVSKFHHYSPTNAWLIVAQCPQASHVKGFKGWLELGRCVMKGQKGITIIAPRTWKREADNGEELSGMYFTAATVFDISQTAPIDGHPKPFQPIEPTILDDESGSELLSKLRGKLTADGYTLLSGDAYAHGGARGWINKESKQIWVDDLPPLQTLKTTIHEAAHGYVCDLGVSLNREAEEVVVESAAYVVLQHFGLDSEGYSLPYVASWFKEDRKAFEKGLGHIQKLAAKLIDTLEAPNLERVAA